MVDCRGSNRQSYGRKGPLRNDQATGRTAVKAVKQEEEGESKSGKGVMSRVVLEVKPRRG